MAPPAKGPSNPDPILQRLMALHPKAIDLSLDRLRPLLSRLGDPHLHLPPVVHVAGSKGKGSTLAFLRAIAEAAGYSVHAYISPHLVRFNERIRLNGTLIDDERLSALLERCEAANRGEPITFFEITTAAAFTAFAETPADLLLLETGLGGEFDATNLVPQPALTAITPIGIDHVQFLGPTLTEIAKAKAGIIKPGVPCVVGPQPDEAMAVIAAKAAERNAVLLRQGHEWQVREGEDCIVWEDRSTAYRLPRPALPGPHQIVNAGAAIACARALERFSFPESAIAAGLRGVDWPARLQRLARGPLVDALPPQTELWLDGAHNAMAGAALAIALAEMPARPTWLISGMLNTKDAAGFLRPLAPLMQAARCLRIPGEANSLPAEDLAATARSVGLDARPAGGLTEAVTEVAEMIRTRTINGPARVVIAGSLYLAGRVLAENS